MSNTRTIINIEKGPIKIFWTLQENKDEQIRTQTPAPATEEENFESPQTGWKYLATIDDDP